MAEDDAEAELASRNGTATVADERPKFKAPKSLIDVPEVPNPKKIDGIIYPNAPKIPNIPKVPELSEDALEPEFDVRNLIFN